MTGFTTGPGRCPRCRRPAPTSGPGFDALGSRSRPARRAGAARCCPARAAADRGRGGGRRLGAAGRDPPRAPGDGRRFRGDGGGHARVRLRCRNAVPHGRGLGSSSAAIVGGLALARALVVAGGERLDDAGLFDAGGRDRGSPGQRGSGCLRRLHRRLRAGGRLSAPCGWRSTPRWSSSPRSRRPAGDRGRPGAAAGRWSRTRTRRTTPVGRRCSSPRSTGRPERAAGGHRGPAAPELPGGGDAGVARRRRGAARGRGCGRRLGGRPDGPGDPPRGPGRGDGVLVPVGWRASGVSVDPTGVRRVESRPRS